MSTSASWPLVLFTFTSVLLAGCGNDSNPASPTSFSDTSFLASEPFTFALPASGQTAFRLEGINGAVTLTGGSGGMVTITGERQVGSSSLSDAQAGLSELQVDVQDLGTSILVRTNQPQNSDGRSYMVRYSVTLPAAVVFDVINVNGTVTTTGMSAGGSVSLVNGAIDASLEVPSGGAVNLTTVNGEIALSLPQDTSAAFSARLTNGTITLTNLMLQNEVRTNRSVQGTLGAGDGTVGLTTTNGSIRVTGR